MVEVRDGRTGDISFIYATILRNLYHSCPLYAEIDKKAFFDNYGEVVHRLLLKPSISLKVATLAEEPDVVLGYLLSEPGLIHFIYIKGAWRGQGIARSLVGSSVFSFCTHLTYTGNDIRKRMGLKYDPFRI